MFTLWQSTLTLALLVTGTALAASQEQTRRDPYAAPPAAAVPPSAETPAGEELVERVEAFITSFYLSGADLSAEQMAVLYAPRVDYFGDRDRSRASVVRDKLAYFRRWPDRRYALVPDTLVVERIAGTDGLVRAEFEYDFDVRSNRRRSAGRGIAELVLDLGVEGGAIAGEGGRVLERR